MRNGVLRPVDVDRELVLLVKAFEEVAVADSGIVTNPAPAPPAAALAAAAPAAHAHRRLSAKRAHDDEVHAFKTRKDAFHHRHSHSSNPAVNPVPAADPVINPSDTIVHSLNGKVLCGLQGLTMTVGDRVRWYMVALGNEVSDGERRGWL